MPRATIYRKSARYGIIAPASTGHATPYRLNLRTASCHRRRRVTCRPSPLPRPVRQRSKLPGPGLAPGGEPPGLGTGDGVRYRPGVRLTPADVGQRVVIRWLRPSPVTANRSPTSWAFSENNPASFAVPTSDGALVVIPAARALAGKVVPPAPQNRRRAGPSSLTGARQRVAVHPSPLEGVVVGHHPAGRQPSPRDSHRLHSARNSISSSSSRSRAARYAADFLEPDTHQFLSR